MCIIPTSWMRILPPFQYSCSVCKYFPHGVRNHDWKGTQVLLSKLNPDTIPFSLNLSSNAKRFLLSTIVLLLLVYKASRVSARTRMQGYSGSLARRC